MIFGALPHMSRCLMFSIVFPFPHLTVVVCSTRPPCCPRHRPREWRICTASTHTSSFRREESTRAARIHLHLPRLRTVATMDHGFFPRLVYVSYGLFPTSPWAHIFDTSPYYFQLRMVYLGC
jgi:hypothetical protein